MTGASPPPNGMRGATFEPAVMADVELSEPLRLAVCEPGRRLADYRRAIALVRLHGHPLGMVELRDPAAVAADVLAAQVWRPLGDEIWGHLERDGVPPTAPPAGGYDLPDAAACLEARRRVLANPPPMSVVVPTRERPDRLHVCLTALERLQYPDFEIIVVDNAPASDATRDVVRRHESRGVPLEYLREDRPGASAARNLGLRVASAEFVAFADDDVVVDRQWLAAVAEAFHAVERVGCVTGPVLPLQNETLAQAWMEQFAEFRTGFHREVFDLDEHRSDRPLYPYNPGVFGSGGGMAFRRGALEAVGGFDRALGPATPAKAGEELAAFLAVVLDGHRIVFEPAALVRHSEILEYDALKQRAHDYGVGLGAYLTKALVDHPRLVIDVLSNVPYGLYLTFSSRSPKHARRQRDFPSELNRAELRGMVKGPLAYLTGRTRDRRRHRTIPESNPRASSPGMPSSRPEDPANRRPPPR